MSIPSVESLAWELDTFSNLHGMASNTFSLFFDESPRLRSLALYNFPLVLFASDWPIHSTGVHLAFSADIAQAFDHDELFTTLDDVRVLNTVDGADETTWGAWCHHISQFIQV
ncbi:hypothetical protein BV25DRAFT_1824178 [Artomyces pyxidatus]|uniref:Uncharacterized protein n=1 Tax=Artomyces pyxidatus TaxID=48021 RepID=A0ACB8T5B0_9AGAM|nr:hypothetical protein BV25DRAFT_1824178 [Artomyces pyxidatus]